VRQPPQDARLGLATAVHGTVGREGLGPVLACAAALLVGASPLACAPEPPEGPHPLWSTDPSSLDNPWPDGRLVDGEGRLVMRTDYFLPFLPPPTITAEADALFRGYSEQLTDLDGFGTYAGICVRFSAPLDAASVTAEALHVVALETDTAEPVPLQVQWHERPPYAELLPSTPMLPATRYAIVVGPGLTAEGLALVRSPDYWRHAQDEGAADHSAAAARAGLDPDDVVLVSAFRTQSLTAPFVAAVERVLAHEPLVDFSGAGAEAGHPRGVFSAQDFVALEPERAEELASASLVAIGTYTSLDLRDEDGLWPTGAATPTTTSSNAVEVVVVQPDPARFPPPWPVVLAQHGFSGENRFVFQVARELNDAGFAVAGIDVIDHGSRGNVFAFFNVEDMRLVRDKFRQTVLDQIQLTQLLRAGTIDIDGQAGSDFDGQVRYFGHSLGGILGGMYAPLAPQGPSAVLHAGGGGIARIMGSDGLGFAISILVGPAMGLSIEDPDYEHTLYFIQVVSQTLLDAGDPINFGHMRTTARPDYATRQPRVLLQEGVGDRTMPNDQTEQLAAALGLLPLTAAARDGEGLSALWRVDPADFGVDPELNPHDTFFHVAAVREQAAAYLQSDGTAVQALAAP